VERVKFSLSCEKKNATHVLLKFPEIDVKREICETLTLLMWRIWLDS